MSYDASHLNASGLWRARILAVRALDKIDDALAGMLTDESDCTDNATSRAMLTGVQRSCLELIRHLDENYTVNNVLDGRGRGSLELKEDSPCLD
jgi:hypothetical protein